MASVSSLDTDLKNLRLSKYTPQASAMVRDWISSILHDQLPDKDLMDLLKDGTILCRLANLIADRQIRFKTSTMPFVQRENISHFLNFVSAPPISLPPHDRFLTVDLFDRKDPAQVIQCLSAFSRAAHALDPAKFPDTIGGLKGGVLSPSLSPQPSGAKSPIGTPVSPTAPGQKKKDVVTAWSKKDQEFTTTPAWNVVQYGYMGGASQNQGISFGARRQITQTPVISDFEKRRAVEREERDKLRKQQAQEAEELKKQQEALKAKEDEVKRQREQERKMEEAERERARAEEEAAAKAKARERELEAQRQREKASREAELREAREEAARRQRYNDQVATQRDAAARNQQPTYPHDDPLLDPLLRERERVKQLERELAEAREREKMYLAARGELVWDPNSTTTIQNPAVQIDISDIPKRKLPTPPPRTTPQLQPQSRTWLQSEQAGAVERKKSWEEGDDKKPLDSPTKQVQRPVLKWQRPQSRGTDTTEKRVYQQSPPRTGPGMAGMAIGVGAGDQWRPQVKNPMTFLERERERERLRQKEWEKEHMAGM